MQVKKEDLRLTILNAATDEFFKKGYENSSMRTIAKKSNTTLGNIYHYFPNKESLLEEILAPTIKNVEIALKQHLAREIPRLEPQDVLDYLDIMESNFEINEFNCFLDKNIYIVLELKSTKIIKKREALIEILKNHLKCHLFLTDDDDHYAVIAINMLIECLKHVLKEHPQPDQARAEFIKFVRMFCTGIIRKTQ